MDLEAMIRHSYEFNFNITALHHALDAYRIPDIIKRSRNQITIATFADLWGYKKEAFQASTQSPRILTEAGIPVALKSDHPVLSSVFVRHSIRLIYDNRVTGGMCLSFPKYISNI